MKIRWTLIFFAATLLWHSVVFAVSQPAQTGQSTCYDSIGSVVPCNASGQDGEIKAGVAWPGQRFVNNGDGTVTDSLTGLMWVRDTSVPGAPTWQGNWQNALDFVAARTTYLTHNDWRMPNIEELRSLINYEQGNPKNWLMSNQFLNLPSISSDYFWSSTTASSTFTEAYVLVPNTGVVETRSKAASGGYLWLVRGPVTAGTVQLPQTGQSSCHDTAGVQIACTGTFQDGDIRSGASWPAPRFTANSDQTITDNLTGLTWTKDANPMLLFNPGYDTDGTARDGAVNWQHALNFVSSLNQVTYLGFPDWRLPNYSELASMLNLGQTNPAAWLANQGFTDLPVGTDFPWTSTTLTNGAGQTLTLNLETGSHQQTPKGAFGFVWPVRGGLFGSAILSFSPATVDFGSVTMGGTSTAHELVISNGTSKNQNLVVNSLTLAGADKLLFTISPGGTNPCASLNPTVVPGTNCTLSAVFSPDNSSGVKQADISIVSNASATPTLVHLTGTAVDGIPPSGTIQINAGAQFTSSSSVTLNLSATDNVGVTEMRFSNDNSNWSAWTGYATSVSWSLTVNDGLKTVYAQFRDAANNISNTVFTTITLKSVAPTAAIISGLPAGGFTNATAMVLAISSPDGVEYSYTLNPSPGAPATLAPAQSTWTPLRTPLVMTNLPEGNYAIVVNVRDIAGNLQTSATTSNFTVDRTPPTLTINPASVPSPTNVSNPSINGTVEVGVLTVGVTVNSTFLGYATVSGASWNFQLSGFNAGNNLISVTATDPAGNSRTLTTTIIYDNVPPAAVISASSINSPLVPAVTNMKLATFVVSGTKVVAYRYRYATSATAFTATNPPFQGDAITGIATDTPIQLTNLVDNTYTLQVLGRDLAGNWQAVSSATSYSWKVDTIAPTFSVTQPSSPTSSTSLNLAIVGVSESSTLTAASIDSVTDPANPRVIDSKIQNNVTGGWTFTLTLQNNLRNKIQVTATDAAGNSTTAVVYVDVTQNIPTATITPNFSGGFSTMNTATFTIAGTGVVEYQWKLDVGAWSAFAPVQTQLNIPATGTLADGNHTLSVAGRDAAGNAQAQGTPSVFTWTVAANPSIATVTGAPTGITTTTTANLTIGGTGVVSYKYRLDNQAAYSAVTPIFSQINLTNLIDGKHTVYVIGQDAYGNWQTTPTIASWTVDTVPPALTVDPPSSPTNSARITGTISAGATLAAFVNGSATPTSIIGTARTIDSSWNFTFSGLPQGANTIGFVATDGAGNTSGAPKTVSFFYDNVPPTATITGTVANSGSTTASTAVFTVGGAGVVSYQYKLSTAGSYSDDIPVANRIAFNGLAPGSFTLQVRGRDNAGNLQPLGTPTQLTWTVTTASPLVTVVPVSSPTKVNGQILIGTMETGATVAVTTSTLPAPTVGSVTYPSATTWQCALGFQSGTDTPFQQGDNVFTITATSAGGTTTNSVVIVYDTVLPIAVATGDVIDTSTTSSVNASSITLTISGAKVAKYKYSIISSPGVIASTPIENAFVDLAANPNISLTGAGATALPEGSYTIDILAQDAAGNTQVVATRVTFIIDRTPPTVTLDPVTSPVNVSTQTLTGTREANATVTVTFSTAAVCGPVTYPAAGTWRCDASGLVSGANNITVTAKDKADNPGLSTGQIISAVTPPTATVTVLVPTGGVLPVLTRLNSFEFIISGTSAVLIPVPKYKYTITPDPVAGGGSLSPLQNATTDVANHLFLNNLPPNTYTLSVYVQDSAGNWQESPKKMIWTVDNTPPTATISPATVTSPNNAKTLNFVVGGSGVTKYQYRLDANNWNPATDIRSQIALINLGYGSHTLYVSGIDQAGNKQSFDAADTYLGDATTTKITWDTQQNVPVLTVDPAVLNTPTAAATVTLQGTITVDTLVSLAGITAFNAANNTTISATVSSGNWTVSTLPLAPGSNSITLTATDSAGNSTAHTVVIERMASAPTALITGGSLFNSNGTQKQQTNDTSVNLTIGGTGVVSYQYRLDSASWSTDQSIGTRLSITGLTQLPNPHVLSIVGTDAAGNQQDKNTPTSISWTVDTTPPALTVNQVVSPTRFTSQTIGGTVEPGCTVRVISSSAIGGAASVIGPNWTQTVNGLSVGPNIVTATATDPAGNTTSVSVIIAYDNVQPVATINGGPANSSITRATDAIFTIGGDGVVTYRYSIDNGAFSTDIPVATPLTLASLSDGVHTLLVLGKKINGLEQASATSLSWTVDTVPPTVVITGTPPAQTKLNSAILTISGTGVVYYRYSLDGGPYSAEIPVSLTIQLSALSVGNHQVNVLGRDQVGNWQVTPTSVNWTIDTTPPSLTLNTVTARTVINNQRLAGSVEPGATVMIDVNTTATKGPAIVTGSSWSFLMTGLIMGPNDITITATDTAGNQTVISTSITLYTPPVTALTGVPTLPTNASTITLTVSGTGVVAYKYSLDGSAYSDETAIATPLILTGTSLLTEGTHALYVIGRDASGIWQTPPTQANFTIDRTAPTSVTISGMPGSPTSITSLGLTISGGDVDFYSYRLDNGTPSAFVPVATALSITGIADGIHTLSVTGKDLAGNVQQVPTSVTWTVDTTPPVTLASPPGATFNGNQTVTLSTNETATIYYTTDGSNPTTSSTVYTVPLVMSINTVLKYRAVDPAGNTELVKTQNYVFVANGDLNGDGKVDIADALMALRYAAKIGSPTTAELQRADLAPLLNKKPKPDGKIDIADVLVILQIVVGILKF